MRQHARKDGTQAAIVAGLRRLGASVEVLNGAGLPDLLVGFRGRNYLMEVKTAGGHLTFDQFNFFKTWRGQAAIVWSFDDARKVLQC